ncbi:MAG: methylmalonyl-CoA mutase family protein [Candidatus Marinimicrobia bacterium]|jgi:methylmalonyl-CoA mutase, N-terminal domain|nr:methylmalonyl-CoA mutase family protein [Candidatus Neomarinimicrobiota bacterium]MBT4946210.1 methylmalonyl-CoA mutase family protein [Candidatus Neomarinimicrobiota bacterium]MBT5269720.1 methylmalonyl-CoA mutase family protein [Candidatus Neomarinimicrobiota bacterium]MBT6012071.1 methylmalonyl-CoA mutase family protein [Candidatus Neomarinimicrobiota bacterium]
MPDQSYHDSLKRWKQKVSESKEREYDYDTVSGLTNDLLYLPNEENQDLDQYIEKIGFPGEYPFTRGVHPNMYRGRLWTMRQFAGFGTPEDTNKRFKFLLEQGQTGLSVAFDMPTLMGYDSDHALSLGEVGHCGVSINSIDDMMTLFDGIPLDQVSTSMTINGPAIILLAMYVVVGERQGVSSDKLHGTLQNDILKEYIAQKEFIFPPEPSMHIITDMIEWCSDHMPAYNTISISGYHIREAGSTAAQELAFTLADGFAYVEAAIERGLDVDKFARRLSFFFNSHIDFFEEIGKFRAARRIYAKRMKEKYGAKDPRSWMLRFHTQTAGHSLTAPQPENNIVRTAYEALAGVLGGTQSLHTNSMDEVLALPTEKSVEIALRTQQVIAYETGVGSTIDPLGGSYYVEAMTDKMEAEAEKYFETIDELGGVVAAIEVGYFQREIGKAAYDIARKYDEKKRLIVGVNAFIRENETIDIPVLKIDKSVEENQVSKVKSLRSIRTQASTDKALADLTQACESGTNVMPPLLEAVRHSATLGEMVDAMKIVYGTYTETPVF